MKYVLKRIGIGSAFKVGFVLGALLSAIVLLPFGFLMALGILGSEGRMTELLAASAVSGVITMFCGPLIYGFLYGLGAALSALIYNIVAGVIGGLELTLEGNNQSW